MVVFASFPWIHDFRGRHECVNLAYHNRYIYICIYIYICMYIYIYVYIYVYICIYICIYIYVYIYIYIYIYILIEVSIYAHAHKPALTRGIWWSACLAAFLGSEHCGDGAASCWCWARCSHQPLGIADVNLGSLGCHFLGEKQILRYLKISYDILSTFTFTIVLSFQCATWFSPGWWSSNENAQIAPWWRWTKNSLFTSQRSSMHI